MPLRSVCSLTYGKVCFFVGWTLSLFYPPFDFDLWFILRNPFLETITIFIVLESKSEKGVFNLLSKKAKARLCTVRTSFYTSYGCQGQGSFWGILQLNPWLGRHP